MHTELIDENAKSIREILSELGIQNSNVLERFHNNKTAL